MRAINVTSFGSAPTFTDAAPAPASSSSSATQIKVLAAGLPQLVRSQAAGTHYSVQNAPLPYTPGIDGVGYTATDNKLVYFSALATRPPGGAFAETVTIANEALTPVTLPSNIRSDAAAQREEAIKIAALINPFMSSWMALKRRAHIAELQSPGENAKFNILILGATSVSGRLATLVARHIGAGEIIGVARDAAALTKLKDAGIINHAITLDATDLSKTDYSLLNSVRVHVVLDYIYGPHALALLTALPSSASKADDLEVRFVHVGTLGREAEIPLPGPLLRSKNVVLSGSGPGSWSVRALAREIGPMVNAIVGLVKAENWREVYGVVERKLEEAEEAWSDTKSRSVFVI